jgi:hypothetical protein
MKSIENIEAFVDAGRAAEFLCLPRRRVLELARKGDIPGHPIGSGSRKTWRFRLSELAATLAERRLAAVLKSDIIQTGSPRQPNRRN